MGSLITSLTKVGTAGIHPAVTFDFLPGNSAQSIVSGTIYLAQPQIEVPTLISALSYFVGTASGNVNLGVYRSPDKATFTLLAATASTAASGASAFQTISLPSSMLLLPGDYLSFQADNAIITAGRTSATLLAALGTRAVVKTGLSYGLVANASTITSASGGSEPLIWIGAT